LLKQPCLTSCDLVALDRVFLHEIAETPAGSPTGAQTGGQLAGGSLGQAFMPGDLPAQFYQARMRRELQVKLTIEILSLRIALPTQQGFVHGRRD
jgi:hypothetical protein